MNRLKLHLWLVALFGICVSCAPVGDVETPVDQSKLRPLDPIHVPTHLKARIEAALENVDHRALKTTHSFWTVFHGILGLGFDLKLIDPKTGAEVNAIQYIRDGGEIRGLQFIPTPDGLDVKMGPSYDGQGHQDQFIAEMAQWGMTMDKKFVVYGKDYTFEDFIRHSKMHASVKKDQELSWAIITIGEFYGTDISWTNKYNEKLHYDDVVRYELKQPIARNAACGGTHRLFGLTWALHRHLQRGGKKTQVWQDVEDTLAKYVGEARKYQNKDGSFSTEYMGGPGNVQNIDRRINTTGHIVEWLSLTLTDDELREQWMQDAVAALSTMILESERSALEGGALLDAGSLYHAAHGLNIYYARVFGNTPKAGRWTLIPPHPKG